MNEPQARLNNREPATVSYETHRHLVGLTVEQRVELARAMGRIEMEQEAMQVVGRIVLSAGGEVIVPDNLMVENVDVSMWRNPASGATEYRARLSPESPEPLP